MAFDISSLREGDIITIRCQVKYAPGADATSVYVTVNGYTTANVDQGEIERLVCEKLTVGQTVWHKFAPMVEGEVLFLTDAKALVR